MSNQGRKIGNFQGGAERQFGGSPPSFCTSVSNYYHDLIEYYMDKDNTNTCWYNCLWTIQERGRTSVRYNL